MEGFESGVPDAFEFAAWKPTLPRTRERRPQTA